MIKLTNKNWLLAINTLKKKDIILKKIINRYRSEKLQSKKNAFLTLAKSNVNSIPASLGWKLPNHINHHNYQLKNAWIGKCDQLITKARFSMKDDKKTLEEIEVYATELKIK